MSILQDEAIQALSDASAAKTQAVWDFFNDYLYAGDARRLGTALFVADEPADEAVNSYLSDSSTFACTAL